MTFQKILYSIEDRKLSKSLSLALQLAIENELNDFENWIRLECYGYESSNKAVRKDTELPEYRKVRGMHLDEYRRVIQFTSSLEFINELFINKSVVQLESLLEKGGYVVIQDPNYTQIIEEYLEIKPFAFQFHSNSIVGILNSIKSELIDYLIKHKSLTPDLPATKSNDEGIWIFSPNFYGLGINLKALFRKYFKR